MEYVDEQHQVEHLKKLFKEYGLPILGGIVIAIIILLGWQYYQAHKAQLAQRASSQYMQMLNAQGAHKEDVVKNKAQAIMKQYPSTAYAVLSAMVLAHYQIEDKAYDQAAQKLEWAINNTSMPMLKSISRIRLARVALQQGNQDKAMKQLSQIKSSAFQGLAQEVKGDIQAKQHHYAQAYKSYQKAQQLLAKNGARQPLLPMKIANLPVTATQSTSTNSHLPHHG